MAPTVAWGATAQFRSRGSRAESRCIRPGTGDALAVEASAHGYAGNGRLAHTERDGRGFIIPPSPGNVGKPRAAAHVERQNRKVTPTVPRQKRKSLRPRSNGPSPSLSCSDR